MSWLPPTTTTTTVARAGLSLAGVGTGSWITMAAVVADKPLEVGAGAAIIIAVAVGNCIPKIVESIYRRRPAVIRARSDARVLRRHSKVRAKLLLQGTKTPEKLSQVQELLRLQALDPALPPDRRLTDEILGPRLSPTKERPSGRKPTSPPRGGTVVPLRQPPED